VLAHDVFRQAETLRDFVDELGVEQIGVELLATVCAISPPPLAY
jgi:hypothetical protein